MAKKTLIIRSNNPFALYTVCWMSDVRCVAMDYGIFHPFELLALLSKHVRASEGDFSHFRAFIKHSNGNWIWCISQKDKPKLNGTLLDKSAVHFIYVLLNPRSVKLIWSGSNSALLISIEKISISISESEATSIGDFMNFHTHTHREKTRESKRAWTVFGNKTISYCLNRAEAHHTIFQFALKIVFFIKLDEFE